MSDKPTISSEIGRLKSEYPILMDHMPLALGIHKQLVPLIDLNHKASKRLIYRLVSHKKYIRSLSQGGSRHNLDGSISGVISDKDMAHAKQLIGATQKPSKGDKPIMDMPIHPMFKGTLTLKRT